MTQTHTMRATLDRLGEAYATRNLDLALSTLEPTVMWDISGPADVPYTGVFYGHTGFARFWMLLNATVDIQQAGVQDTLFGDNVAVALGGEAGRTLADDRPYHYDWAIVYWFGSDGRIARMRQYYDPGRIAAALARAVDWPEPAADHAMQPVSRSKGGARHDGNRTQP